MRRAIYLMGAAVFLLACESKQEVKIEESKEENKEKVQIIEESSGKIKVLNFSTFHMGNTSDSHKVEFDQSAKKNLSDAKEIAGLISEFKPTVICVEIVPEEQGELDSTYQSFMNTNQEFSSYYGEIGMVAFQVGRINGIKNIYGIDHQLGYNYRIGSQIENAIDSTTYKEYFKDPFVDVPEFKSNFDSLSLLNKLNRLNHPKYLDFLMLVNADILTFAGTEGNFEGADEASIFYKRNLRMFSNLNRLDLKKEDRVFIIMGGAHTAFFNDFLKRSPKYETVDVFDYLK